MSLHNEEGVEQTSDGGGAGAGDVFDEQGRDVTKPSPGAPPTGAAGGDLSGFYPNPQVIDDSHLHTAATLPATIVYDGDPAGGDLAGTYPNPDLDSIHGGFGPTGSSTVVPIVTVDTKGRTTALTSVAIAFPAGGDSIQVNSVPVTDANLNDLVPAATGFGINAKWQRTGSGPDSVSAFVDDGRRATADWSFQGDITPPSLVASVNNYSPAGLATATVLRLSAV